MKEQAKSKDAHAFALKFKALCDEYDVSVVVNICPYYGNFQDVELCCGEKRVAACYDGEGEWTHFLLDYGV